MPVVINNAAGGAVKELKALEIYKKQKIVTNTFVSVQQQC